MRLEKIITLANARVRLRFLAMERSLRATGCELPLRVIPYDEERFDLPANAEWLLNPELAAWLERQGTHPTMRKYHCLLEPQYQFVDADVCFVRNPETALEPHCGFITSCGHWHNPGDTVTPDSLAWLRARSTTWQRWVFNTGQFACEHRLYELRELKARAEEPSFRQACLEWPYHEQPGVNQLAIASGEPVTNLTLPPTGMESTWAGDYSDGDYRRFWRTEKETPYLIHWAGVDMRNARPINELFCSFLTAAEKAEWAKQLKTRKPGALAASVRRARASARAAARAWRS